MATFREDGERLNAEALALRHEAAALLDSADDVTDDIESQVGAKLEEAEEKEARADRLFKLAERADKNAAAMDALSATPRRKTAADEAIVVRSGLEDDPKRGFANLGEFAVAVKAAGPEENWSRDKRLLIGAAAGTGMEQGKTSAGGALIPPAFSTAIWQGTMTRSNSLLQYCDRVPIDDGAESITFPATDETSRVDGSRHGGVTGYWKGELDQLTSSLPTLRQVRFEPQELYVFSYVSDKLLRRPVALSAWLGEKAADELAFKIGDSIINGDGVGKPKGILNTSARVSVAKETNQAAATVVKENIDKMYARCHANYRSGAVWFINQDVEPQLENLSAAVGTGGVPVYLPAGGYTNAPNARLKGLPVVPIEYAATLGTEGDIMLLNLKAYGMAFRGLVDQNVSAHLKFDYAQSCFRWIVEADGSSWLESAITPYKGSNTLSPFLTLATRS